MTKKSYIKQPTKENLSGSNDAFPSTRTHGQTHAQQPRCPVSAMWCWSAFLGYTSPSWVAGSCSAVFSMGP